MSQRCSHIAEQFIVLTPKLQALPIAVSNELYSQLDQQFDQFKSHQLVSMYDSNESWPNWEKHPAGDEVVLLLAGACVMHIETATGVTEHRLQTAGDFVVIPRDCWHTATIARSCRLLFITPGEGTAHRAR